MKDAATRIQLTHNAFISWALQVTHNIDLSLISYGRRDCCRTPFCVKFVTTSHVFLQFVVTKAVSS